MLHLPHWRLLLLSSKHGSPLPGSDIVLTPLGKNASTSLTSVAITLTSDLNIGDTVLIHTGSGTSSTQLTGVVDSGGVNAYTVQLAETVANGVGRAICTVTSFLAAGSTITASFSGAAARHSVIGTKAKNLTVVAETPASVGTTAASLSIASGAMDLTPQLFIGVIMWSGNDPGAVSGVNGATILDSTLSPCWMSVVGKVVDSHAGDTLDTAWITSRAFRANAVAIGSTTTKYDFLDRFDLASPGALTQTLLPTIYPDPAVNSFTVPSGDDTMAGIFSIVTEAAATNGHGLRTKYPANHHGELFWFAPKILNPSAVANIEFKVRFESGFQLNPDPAGLLAGGKFGPSIDHSSISAAPSGGTRAQFWWIGNGSNFAAPKFSPILQTAVGGELVQPVTYGPAVVVGQTYKIRMSSRGGAGGFAKFRLDDVLLFDWEGEQPNTTFDGSHFFRHMGFAGGATTAYDPTVDCFTTMWDVHMWAT